MNTINDIINLKNQKNKYVDLVMKLMKDVYGSEFEKLKLSNKRYIFYNIVTDKIMLQNQVELIKEYSTNFND